MVTRKAKAMLSLRCVLVFLACVLAGCRSPASIYPVYQPKDLYVDDSILGTWTQCEDSDNPRVVISVEKCKSDPKAYDVEFWQEGKSQHSRSELRLTRIGQYSFADVQPPASSERSAPKTPGPIMPMHLFARLTIKPKAVLAMVEASRGAEARGESRAVARGSGDDEGRVGRHARPRAQVGLIAVARESPRAKLP